MTHSKLVPHAALILVVTGVVFFLNLGTPRLWDRDEPRNAGCASEMLARGDWVVPVFNGQLREQKPALLYWLIMAAYGLVGTNEWGARLPSAVLAVGSVLTTYAIGHRLFGAKPALWGSLALATSLMFDMAARAATPDSTLIFFSTLGIAVFVYGVFPPLEEITEREAACSSNEWPRFRRALPWRVAAPLYGALGFAVLAKGPVGVVLPVAVMGMFLLIARLPRREEQASRWQYISLLVRPFGPTNFVGACRQLQPMAAFAVLSIVALPWYVWVGIRTEGAWLEGFFWNDNLRRAFEPLDDHNGSIFFYLLAILTGFFPWSVFALPVALETWARLRRPDRRTAAYLLCVCWIGVYVALFSLAQTKLPSYVTPCYPALAMLTGVFLARWIGRDLLAAWWWPRVAMGVLAAVGVALLIALPVAAKHFIPGDEWLGLVALVPLVGSLVAKFFAWQGNRARAVGALAISAAVFQAAFFGGVLVHVDQRQQASLLFAEIARRSDEPRIASYGCLESSWVYYSGRPIQEFLPGGNATPTRPYSVSYNADFRARQNIREFAAQVDTFIITTEDQLPTLRPLLGPEVRVLVEVPYFLEREKLVLLGRDSRHAASESLASLER